MEAWQLRRLATLVALCGIAHSVYGIDSPLSPSKALEVFQHDPGLHVELVAAEPLVFQPCALAWDAEGRLFVVENRGYPNGPGAHKPPAGVIALLDDTDGDGRMDRRTIFADGLTFPNGITRWNGGLIVTCAPDILFLKDTNGDGRADEKRVLLTGFNTTATTQLRVSHPTFGPDSWIYLTSGLTGSSKITSPAHPERSAVEIVTDSRFNPFSLEIEPVGGRGQFGQTFDDAGNRFHCMNRVHIQHTVIPPRLLGRNPNFASSETVQNVPEAMFTDLIGGANQNFAARLYPISENITTADSHLGAFTAACSVHIYRGDGLGTEYRGDAFVCDPTANVVHRDHLSQVGPTFASRMANEGREFLASPDNWFRPVFLATGPEGALYLCDMYRKTIEHPDYLPEEVRKRTDFQSGHDLGRIWRVTTNKKQVLFPKFRSVYSREELIQQLGNPNGWHRDTAQRLLVEQRDPKTVALLANLFALATPDELKRREEILLTKGWHGLPPDLEPTNRFARLHGLRTLAILASEDIGDPVSNRALLDRVLRASLLSSDPILRENAWRILSENDRMTPRFPEGLLPVFAADSNPRARFWFTLAPRWGLDVSQAEDHLSILAQLARSDGTNRWMRSAILSGLDPRGNHALRLAIHLAHSTQVSAPVEFWFDLGTVIGAETDTLPTMLPKDTNSLRGFIAAFDGISRSIRSRGKPVTFHNELLTRLSAGAVQLAASSAETVATRKSAIDFLVNADSTQATAALLPLLTATEPEKLQSAAIRSLLALPTETSATNLLNPSRWNLLSPTSRDVVIASLLAQPRHIRTLLTAIDQKWLPENVLSRRQRDSLRNHGELAIRERAQQLLAPAEAGDRMDIFKRSRSVLALKGNPVNGRKPFAANCASCHRLDREGHNVGPDLFGIRNQPKENILLHIVHPNYEFVAGFNSCTITSKDGRELTGLITSESPSSVTLRQPQGIEETFLRSSIAKLTVSPISLMPEGLESTMSPQELADLLACLKGE